MEVKRVHFCLISMELSIEGCPDDTCDCSGAIQIGYLEGTNNGWMFISENFQPEHNSLSDYLRHVDPLAGWDQQLLRRVLVESGYHNIEFE